MGLVIRSALRIKEGSFLQVLQEVQLFVMSVHIKMQLSHQDMQCWVVAGEVVSGPPRS